MTNDYSTDLVENLWQEVWPLFNKWEEGRDVGEHTGQDERVFGVVVQHGLQQLHALVYRQLLHSEGQKKRGNLHLITINILFLIHIKVFLLPPPPHF